MRTVTILRDQDNEYRVPSPDGNEEGAYYTDDMEDAIGTAKNFMYKDENIKIRFKKVESHS